MKRGRSVIVATLVVAGLLLGFGYISVAVAETGYCGLHPPPPGWIDAALVVFAVAFGFGVGPLVLANKPLTRSKRAIAVGSFVEAAAAMGLVIYIAAKFAHAYDCG